MKNKENKIALITGASQGVGKAIALKLASDNYKLILASRSMQKLNKLKKEILKKFGKRKVELFTINLEERISKKIFNFCKEKVGLPDILINNAGGPEPLNFLKINSKMWKKTLNRNLLSVIDLSRIFSKNMISNNWGRIINISSTVAKEPSSAMVQSATARAAVLAFNKSISYDLAKFNITCNSVLLGGVETARLKNLINKNSKKQKISQKKYKLRLLKSIPVGRFADPKEIADLVKFLVSNNSGYINGQNIIIDGGISKTI